jgi:hypothetical protein
MPARPWSFNVMSATQEQLQEQVAALDRDIAQVDTDYQELVGKLASGDKNALAKADQLDQKRSVLLRSKAMNIAACGLLEQQRQQEQEEQQRESDRRKRTEAKQIADQIMAANVEIDRMLVVLREQFEARANALRALGNTGIVDQAFANKLMAKGPLTAAAQNAGLHRFVDIVTVATASVRALATSNSILINVGRDVEEPSNNVPRRRLANGGDGT